MKFSELLQKENVRPFVLNGRFGLEKESQRVTFSGELAKTDHPETLGNRSFHPYIQTDFSETQMELITPVADSVGEVLRYLAALHDVALRSIDENEMLWPLSMPPALPEKDRDIQIAKLDEFSEVLYRRYLAKEYGKRKQMVSGIHVNFEFAKELIRQLFLSQETYTSIRVFQNALYLKVARNFLRYRWMLTYLFGASPISEDGFFEKDEDRPKGPIRSIRNSSFGYRNHENVQASFASLEEYVTTIQEMVENGVLSEEKEFYSPIRLRGEKTLAQLAQNGVQYLEIRNLDLNPFARLGIEEDALRFIQIFLLYLLWAEEKEKLDDWLKTGEFLNEQVSLGHPFEQVKTLAEGDRIFLEMTEMVEKLNIPEMKPILNHFYEQLRMPEMTVAGRMWPIIATNSNRELGIVYGQEYHAMAHEKPYQLAGFRTMELSTQIFLFDAIQKGLEIDILDEQEQFLKLRYQNHVEYVKNANMTSKDQYIVPLIMENKTVTKKILSDAGFRVPLGREFHSVEEAERAYAFFAEQAFVIKPKTTNYGLGVTIFKDGSSLRDYVDAVSLAFKEDEVILIEEFIHGTEYRFFVLENEVKAILLRVPANIVGDGKHSVEALVSAKNLNPLRGTGHRTPLEKIQLGDLERLILKEQNLTISAIPKAEQLVYLRENSNISTGGDSIDVTDLVDDSYKALAVEAVKTLGAAVCGIDIIIPDQTHPLTQDADDYGIIEANFNPAMHIHVYPHRGKGRRLTLSVLEMLYPELFA